MNYMSSKHQRKVVHNTRKKFIRNMSHNYIKISYHNWQDIVFCYFLIMSFEAIGFILVEICFTHMARMSHPIAVALPSPKTILYVTGL